MTDNCDRGNAATLHPSIRSAVYLKSEQDQMAPYPAAALSFNLAESPAVVGAAPADPAYSPPSPPAGGPAVALAIARSTCRYFPAETENHCLSGRPGIHRA